MSSIRNTRIILLLIFISGLSGTQSAQAALIERDWQVSGDGLITYDTGTGLEWLDLTETVGYSWNDMAQELSTGMLFAGFRHATRSEVDSLIDAAGLVWHGLSATANDQGLIANYHSLLGITQTDFNAYAPNGIQNEYAFGLFNEPAYEIISGESTHYYSFVLRNYVFDYTSVKTVGWLDYRSAGSLGHHLVREVPEPVTMMLFGIGFLSLAVTRRKNTG